MSKEDNLKEKFKLALLSTANAIADDYSPNNDKKNKKKSKIIKDEGIKLFPWTVNDPSDIKSLISLGVDGIITDFPDRVNKE